MILNEQKKELIDKVKITASRKDISLVAACKELGVNPSTYYFYKSALAQGDKTQSKASRKVRRRSKKTQLIELPIPATEKILSDAGDVPMALLIGKPSDIMSALQTMNMFGTSK